VTHEPEAGGLKRVGGNPVFVSAHGIVNETELSFEQAYALAWLVLDEGGGPVSFAGKKAKLKKPMVTELTRRGLVEVVGWSEFTQRVHLELNVDGRVRELLDAKYAGVKITPVAAEQRARWYAQATQAAFNLVAKHVP
jgi:hypothetical protein